MAPLILTLQLDGASTEYFSHLRQKYFPQALNFLPAHVTLFHCLPGEEISAISATLEEMTKGCGPLDIRVTGLRALGRGTAYALESASLSALRNRLSHQWFQWLTPQDRQKFKPHITVQNKVHPDEAKRTMKILAAAFAPHRISGIGLQLWRYLGGPWESIQQFPF